LPQEVEMTNVVCVELPIGRLSLVEVSPDGAVRYVCMEPDALRRDLPLQEALTRWMKPALAQLRSMRPGA
jgi:hypothetical protein